METSELVKFGILTLIVVVIALVARRGQAHATPPASPKKADHVTEEVDADNGRDRRSAVEGEDTRTAGSLETKRRERRRSR